MLPMSSLCIYGKYDTLLYVHSREFHAPVLQIVYPLPDMFQHFPCMFADESGALLSSWQRVQTHGLNKRASNVDFDSLRSFSALSDRHYHSAADRRVVGGGRSSVNERPLQDQDPYLRGYAHFDRSPAVRSYEGAENIDRDAQRDSDREWGWDSDRDRDGRDRDRVVGFRGKDEWDRHREHLDTAFPIRRPGLGPNLGVRYETEPLPLSSSLSMSSMASAIGNGDKKMVFGELGGLPSVAPASSGSLTSNMQKAAFERNFPTLGAQEKGATGVVVQPNVLSPRPLWQGSSTTRLDGTRSSTSSPGLPSSGPNYGLAAAGSSGGSIGAEGWSSALAEAPSALMGSSAAVNGTVVAGPTTNNMSAVSSVAMVITTSDSNSVNPPKMVDALVQFPPRVRTPPQVRRFQRFYLLCISLLNMLASIVLCLCF